uniref:Uncharacterized protein n=1 Tax=Oryza meridionalis TaxID=40149 RepID=A0A0E0E629_9ORYZ
MAEGALCHTAKANRSVEHGTMRSSSTEKTASVVSPWMGLNLLLRLSSAGSGISPDSGVSFQNPAEHVRREEEKLLAKLVALEAAAMEAAAAAVAVVGDADAAVNSTAPSALFAITLVGKSSMEGCLVLEGNDN